MQGAPQDIYCFMIKVYCEKDKRKFTQKKPAKPSV